MFRSLSISNFRGFQDLRVVGLDRFNLFMGRNNVGKTALLEAVFLLAGPTNPELPIRLNWFRGVDQARVDPEELWGWLFYEKDFKKAITIELQDVSGRKRTLILELEERKEIPFKESRRPSPKGSRSSATAATRSPPTTLRLDYRDEADRRFHTRAYISEGLLALEHAPSLAVPNSIYVSGRSGYSSENPERFSKLQEVGGESRLLGPLRILEPRLKSLHVLVTGAGPMIHGDIGIGRMVPVPMMGEGVGRLLTLLLAITASPRAFVMIDEIDSGLHHSVMKDIWSAIAEAARQDDVQVFSTTHSWECLKAAHESFSQAERYDL
ncbi:MAG: AAA family ATPase, partial [Thermoguttaceae bacterium]|nr:AAA family ATPase [Thermoguttaceae bacterium]